MKRKDDVLDADRATTFRWGVELPAPEGPTPEPARLPPEARERIARRADHFAAEIHRAFVAPPAEQHGALVEILESLSDLMTPLVLGQSELASARLFVMLVRHWDRLDEDRRQELAHSLTYMNPGGPLLSELIVELCKRADPHLDFAFDMARRGRPWPEAEDAMGELSRLLHQSPRWRVRSSAVYYLAGIQSPRIVPHLRAALRQPCLRVRRRALESLEPDKGEVLEEDVLFLVEDALRHPVDPDHGRRGDGSYPDLVIRALRHVHPPAVVPPIRRMLAGEGAHIRRLRDGFDEGWALRALAAAAPELARPIVERRVFWGRFEHDALLAAVELGKDVVDALFARRLLGASSPGVEHALSAYERRFGGRPEKPTPDTLQGLPIAPSAPPSDELRGRLSVLRRGSAEAKSLLLQQVLSEPATDEALVLFAFLLGRSGSLWDLKGPGLPSLGLPAWAELFLDRFGERGEAALVQLAEEGERGEGAPWLPELYGLAKRLSAASRERLARLAIARLHGIALDEDTVVLAWLSAFGVPLELREQLLARLDAQRGVYPGFVAGCLAALRDPTLDAHLVAELRASLERGEVGRAARYFRCLEDRAWAGRTALALELVERGDELSPGPEGDALVNAAAWLLARQEERSEEHLMSWLADARSRRLIAACPLIGPDWPSEPLRAQVMELLRAALEVPRAWVEAARVLIHQGGLAKDSPVLRRAVGRVDLPAVERGEVIRLLHDHGETLAPDLAEVTIDLYRSGDRRVWRALDLSPDNLDDEAKESLRRAVRRGEIPAAVEEDVRWLVGMPSEAERYWQYDEHEDDED